MIRHFSIALLCWSLLLSPCRAADSLDSVERAETAIKSITAQLDSGKVADAGLAVDQALSDARKLLGKGHPKTLDLLSLRAEISLEIGKHSEAIAERTEEYEGLVVLYGAEHERTLAARTGLATAITTIGRAHEGAVIYADTLAIQRRVLPPGHVDIAHNVANLASAQMRSGQISAALKNYALGYELRRKALGDEHYLTILALSNYAHGLVSTGRAEEAEPLSRRALELRVKVGGADHFDTAITRNNYAANLERLGRRQDAAAQYDLAVEVLRKSLGDDSPTTLKIRSNAAVSRSRISKPEQALSELEALRTELVQRLGANHPFVDDTHFHLGVVFASLARWTDALESFTVAYEGRAKRASESHPDVLVARYGMAVAAVNLGLTERARSLLVGSIAALEESRSAVRAVSPLAAQTWISTFNEITRRLVELEVTSGNAALALDWLERGRARVLLDLVDERRLLTSEELDPADAAALNALDLQIGERATRLTRLPQGTSRSQAILEFDELTERKKKALDSLAVKHPRLLSKPPPELVEVRHAKEVLRGSTLISYSVDRVGEVVAAVVQPQGTVVWNKLGRRVDLDHLVSAFRVVMSQSGALSGKYSDDRGSVIRVVRYEKQGAVSWRVVTTNRYCTDEEADEETQRSSVVSADRVLGRAFVPATPLADCIPNGAVDVTSSRQIGEIRSTLSALLLAPLRQQMSKASHLVIIPDGGLWGLPWDALLLDGRPLIASRSISVTHSLSVLGLTRARIDRLDADSKSARLLALADAAYGGQAATYRTSKSKRGLPPNLRLRASERLEDVDNLIATHGWPRLPYSRIEARRVSETFPGRADVHTGYAASTETLRRLNGNGELARYQHLLFSVHGYFDPAFPEFSGLLLSPSDRQGAGATMLYAHELQSFRLQSRLAFLSACNTGLGRVHRAEGLSGITYSLMVAGNADAIATIWSIADRETAEFVTRFYREVSRGVSHSDALARVKRSFLNHPNPRLRDPVYWAGFVLFGG